MLFQKRVVCTKLCDSYQISVHLATRFQRKRFFRNQPFRNKKCLWWSYLLTDRDDICNIYRGPSIDASYQVSVHLAKWFQRSIFLRNRPISNRNCLWRPCSLTDQDEMSNLYRRPPIDAFYQVSVHLAKRFQRRIFFLEMNQSATRILKWRPCLLADRNKMCNLYRGPSIDVFYQDSVQVNGRRTPSRGEVS